MFRRQVTIDVSKVAKEEANRVAGKAENLRELTRRSFPVPHGFAVSIDRSQDIDRTSDKGRENLVPRSRLITASAKPTAEDEVLWTRGYADDYWNDPVSPLFFELLGDHLTKIVNVELNKIMGYSELVSARTEKLLRLHKAHAYFNLEVLRRKVENEIPGFLRNEDVLNYFPEGGGPYGKETIKKLPFRLRKRLWAEIRVTLLDHNGTSGRTAKAYDEWTQRIFDPFWESFDSRLAGLKNGPLSGYVALADELDEIMVGHFRLVRYGIPVHNIGMNLLAQYLLARFLGKEEVAKAYPVLVSGLKHKTSETNERIGRMAKLIHTSTELKALVLEKPAEELWDTLSSSRSRDAQEFVKEFKAFLGDFGARGFTREAYFPRWEEAPEYVFDILKSLAAGEILDQEALQAHNLRLQEETVESTKRAIRSQSLGRLKWKLLSGILENARRYIVFREDQRFNLDRWITMHRRICLAIGERLVEDEALEKPSEIFFLAKAEIREAVFGKLAREERERILALVKERKAEFLRYANVTPPKFLEGDREFDDPPLAEAASLKGIPASQGLLTAPVRVLGSVEDIWTVQAGEILVVPRTDPGWTPIFSKIGGLITETGGILSHGAVVSREFGIPAVTNIHDACRILKTGQIVTIDGVKGVVSIEQQP